MPWDPADDLLGVVRVLGAVGPRHDDLWMLVDSGRHHRMDLGLAERSGQGDLGLAAETGTAQQEHAVVQERIS